MIDKVPPLMSQISHDTRIMRLLPRLTSRQPAMSRIQRLFPVAHLLYRAIGRPAHELRWLLQSEEQIDAWVDRRLQLGEDYWLFVLGLNNSGTTLLTRILESHPRMRTLPHEGQWLTPALPHPPTHGAARTWSNRADIFHWTEQHDPTPARRIRYDWARYYPQRPGILLEKSPPNTLRSRWLQANFVPSRFVGLVRHPYALCEGARRRLKANILDTARHWNDGIRILLEDAAHLDAILLIRYEDLTHQPNSTMTSIESFLGFEPGSLSPERFVDIRASYIRDESGPLRNMNASSFARLDREERIQIATICGELMERLGYATDPDPHNETSAGVIPGRAPRGRGWLDTTSGQQIETSD